MRYKQIINDPEHIAATLNYLIEQGKQIEYVLPFHEFDGSLVVIVYTEGEQ